MKYLFLLPVLALGAGPLPAGDEVAKNGAFDKGKFGWDTSPGVRVVEDVVPGKAPNRLLEFTCHRNERRRAWQRITVGNNTHSMKVTFRMKAQPDYAGPSPDAEQFTIRYERRDGGSTFTTRTVPKTPDWTEITFDMNDFSGSQTIDFSIELHPAQGRVWVDDVSIRRIGG